MQQMKLIGRLLKYKESLALLSCPYSIKKSDSSLLKEESDFKFIYF